MDSGVDAQPLSVIVVNDFAEIVGGTDAVALAEAAGLARRGHRVTLVAGRGAPDPELVAAGVAVRSTGQRTTLEDPNRLRGAAQGIWNRAAAALVRALAEQADSAATVVHVHGFTKVLSPSVIRAAVQSGLPTLATLHDYFVACPNGGFFNYQTNRICRLEPMSARCITTHCDARAYSHKLWRVGRSSVQRRFGAMPAGVGDFIVPSRSAGKIVRRFLPPDARFHVVPNPVSVPRTARAEVSQNTAFVFVGRLQRDKGALVFANAARQANVPAVFVGDGEEAGAIRRAYPEAELTGWLDPARVQSVIRTARAFINASQVYETQGLSLMEAAAHGVPSIVSDASVARDAVEDNRTGLWFRSGEPGDLAEKLIALHRRPALARQLGAAAYEHFWSQPRDLPNHLDRLEHIYRASLLAGPRTRRARDSRPA